MREEDDRHTADEKHDDNRQVADLPVFDGPLHGFGIPFTGF